VFLVLALFDFLWLASMGYLWTNDFRNQGYWDQLVAIHVFAIILSVANLILKIVFLIMINAVK
jgi:hypothetical protein